MLSRILTATRNIIPFQRPLSDTTENSDHRVEHTVMVTTRRQSGQQKDLEDQDTLENVPPSNPLNGTPGSAAKKRRREVGSGEKGGREAGCQDAKSTPTSKRQKKLAMRNKDDEEETVVHTHTVTELPLESLYNAADINKKDGLVSPIKEPIQITDSQNKEPNVEATNNTLPQTVLPTAKLHRRFGSEDLKTQPMREMNVELVGEAKSEENSSDDDAPEVVTTSAAARTVKNTAREAARAAESNETNLRWKRKERDAKLKEQAKTKRQEANNKPQVNTKRSNVASPLQKSGAKSEGEVGVEIPLTEIAKEIDIRATKAQKLNRSNLPAFLPSQYFSDTESSPSESDEDSKLVKIQRPNKIKFLDEKRPKDIIKGSTTYRVVQKSGKGSLLAPKSDKSAKKTKEAWLQGRNGRETGVGLGGRGGVRKKEGSAFLVGSVEHKKRRRR